MRKLIGTVLAVCGLTAGLMQAEAGDKARFVILPDTQTCMEECPEVMESQMDWIVENADSIDAVLQVGDLTQENYPAEWYLAHKFYERIHASGVPLSMALGNHDIGSRAFKCSDVYNTDNANRFFPLQEMEQRSYWGDNLYEGRIDAHYISVKAGGRDWKIISLPFGPSDKELEWAGKVADEHPESYIVLNTHAYLYCDSTLIDGEDEWRPTLYGYANDSIRGRANNGDGVWKKFVSRHRNVIAVFCGHVLHGGLGTRVATGKDGNKVYEMMANFQRWVTGSKMGGEGYLRIVEFDFDSGRIDVKTYSTWNKAYHPSPAQNFSFENVRFDDYLRK